MNNLTIGLLILFLYIFFGSIVTIKFCKAVKEENEKMEFMISHERNMVKIPPYSLKEGIYNEKRMG